MDRESGSFNIFGAQSSDLAGAFRLELSRGQVSGDDAHGRRQKNRRGG